jgi:hypothetical protein
MGLVHRRRSSNGRSTKWPHCSIKNYKLFNKVDSLYRVIQKEVCTFKNLFYKNY